MSSMNNAVNAYSAYSIGRQTGVLNYAGTPTKALNSGSNILKNSSISSLMNFDFSSAFDKSSNAFMKEMKSGLSALKASASNFSKNGQSSMFNQSLQSSNSSVVTGQAEMMSRLKGSYSVNVSQIATSQTNTSASFNSKDSSTIGSGSFKINMGSKSSTISYTAKAGDTNEQALTKIASSINSSSSGVSASVVTKDNKSSLQITSKETGTSSSFSMSDTSGANTASSLNMSTTTQAQNANYSVDGRNYTSQSNEVQVGYTASKMTLKGSGEATLSKQTDTSVLLQAAEEFASSYNSVIDTLGSKANAGTGVSRTESLISNALGSSRNLSQLGMTKTQDGKISIDAEKFKKAVSEDPQRAQDTLNRVSSSVNRNADTAGRIPQSAFTNVQKMSYSSMNNALLTSGLLFNIGV